MGRSSNTAAQASRQVVVMIGCALPGIQRQEGDACARARTRLLLIRLQSRYWLDRQGTG
jgi:hypothetical protein